MLLGNCVTAVCQHWHEKATPDKEYSKMWNSSVLDNVRDLLKVVSIQKKKSTIETDKLSSIICFTDFILPCHLNNKLTKGFEFWIGLQDQILGM